MKVIRWSDRDKYFRCFTYCKNDRGHGLAIVLSSGGGYYSRICNMRISAFNRTLISTLPTIIKPWRKWVDLSKHEWSKGGGYWDEHPREYGFSYYEGHLSFLFGAQTMDSVSTQRKGFFLPWTQWRHVRHSFYNTKGEIYSDVPEDWEARKELERTCPSITFSFKDYDGEQLTAKTRIEEREWHFGTGSFKWLSWFKKPKISRYLEINFSGETGKRKGSWKGGTVGHSISMLPDETPWQAFNRYCADKDMTFMGANQ